MLYTIKQGDLENNHSTCSVILYFLKRFLSTCYFYMKFYLALISLSL